eukprot:scaffold15124_cov75-Phaeocystis_antarctica.AAC.2
MMRGECRARLCAPSARDPVVQGWRCEATWAVQWCCMRGCARQAAGAVRLAFAACCGRISKARVAPLCVSVSRL